MSRLPIDREAEATYQNHCRSFYVRLLAKADVYARTRDGNSIQTGDLNKAKDAIEGRGRREQILLGIGGASVGVGLSGLIQNILDGKPVLYLGVFGVVLVIGLALVIAALRSS